ncbi:MAG: DUF1460 domain-containing protein [Nitrospirae bacterium]|nr:DUF1460 domain-containing protein [Nitrospirota bacterium]
MESIILGKWTEERLDSILREAVEIQDIGERIAFLSEKFIGMPYQEKTLIGDINTPEVFVINLSGVDCFTFIDYVEAMRLSGSLDEFKENLKKVRYESGNVYFQNRNHFFTDWIEFNPEFVDDVTEEIGGRNIVKMQKILNLKEDGTYYLAGIEVRGREIKYIPPDAFDDSIIEKLKTGDYAGIYSEKHGLDVLHVGIIIKTADGVYLRHASSIGRKVVDEDFKEYMHGKPGLIILRAKYKGRV